MLSAIRREVSSDALYKAYDVLESADPHEIDLVGCICSSSQKPLSLDSQTLAPCSSRFPLMLNRITIPIQYTDSYQTILDAASSDNVAIRKLAITFVPMFIKLFGPSMQYEAFDRLLDACESPNGPIRTEALAQLLCLCKSDLLTSYKAIDFLGEYICKANPNDIAPYKMALLNLYNLDSVSFLILVMTYLHSGDKAEVKVYLCEFAIANILASKSGHQLRYAHDDSRLSLLAVEIKNAFSSFEFSDEIFEQLCLCIQRLFPLYYDSSLLKIISREMEEDAKGEQKRDENSLVLTLQREIASDLCEAFFTQASIALTDEAIENSADPHDITVRVGIATSFTMPLLEAHVILAVDYAEYISAHVNFVLCDTSFSESSLEGERTNRRNLLMKYAVTLLRHSLTIFQHLVKPPSQSLSDDNGPHNEKLKHDMFILWKRALQLLINTESAANAISLPIEQSLPAVFPSLRQSSRLSNENRMSFFQLIEYAIYGIYMAATSWDFQIDEMLDASLNKRYKFLFALVPQILSDLRAPNGFFKENFLPDESVTAISNLSKSLENIINCVRELLKPCSARRAMTLSITDMTISNQCKSGSNKAPKKEIHNNKKISMESESFRSDGAQNHHGQKSHVRGKKRRNPIDDGDQIPSGKIPINQRNIESVKEERKTTALLTKPRKKPKFNRNQKFVRPSHNSSNTLAHPSRGNQRLPSSLQGNDVSFGIKARSSDVSEPLGGTRLALCGNRRFQQGGPNKAYSCAVEPFQHRLEMSYSDTSQSASRRFIERVPQSSLPEESFLTELNDYPVMQEESEKVSEGQSLYFVEAVIMQPELPWQQWSAGTSGHRRPRLG